jgi:hypothetical protein
MASHEPPAFLDIEASGFGRGSYPIEVGFVLTDGSAWCTLVRPEPGWTHWDAAAEALHGIARATALSHGRSVADAADELNRRLRGLTVYSDGWAHDYAWLALLFDAAGREPAFKLDHLRNALGEADAIGWQAARQRMVTAKPMTRHRASNDARLLQLTWLALRRPPSDQDVSGPCASSAARNPAQ